MKDSTKLSTNESPQDAALAYTYFIRAMAVVLEKFSARYVDIQGDGIFGLFSGSGAIFRATAAAITMKTLVKRDVAIRFQEDTDADWDLTAGIGIDQGTLLVRRLGLRGTKQNEVWAGKPVNIAAKLSSLASPNELIVSDRMFGLYQNASELRQRALIWSCGCNGGKRGAGLDMPIGQTTYLWEKETTPDDLGLDFDNLHRLKSCWCPIHGSEFCEAIVNN